MIPRLLRLLHSKQRGFSLIEVLVVTVVAGIITGGIATGIVQTLTIHTSSVNHMTIVRELQNAGQWISRDTLMSQSVTPTADADGFPLTLIWVDYVTNDEHKVVYTLSADEIQRQHYTNSAINATTLIAQNIDPSGTSCQFSNDKLTLTVTASVTGWQPQSETRTYEVIPRPEQSS